MSLPPAAALRIEEIRRDYSSGAREIAARAAALLSSLPRECLPEAADALIAAQPIMAPLVNLARAALAAPDPSISCREFLSRMEHNAHAVAARAVTLIAEGMTVFTHSYSSTVMEAILSAHAAGRRFSAVMTESRPLNEGVTVAARLASHGLPVKLVLDAAMHRELLRCVRARQPAVALTGADAVWREGVVNKVGTAQLALGARELGVAAYVLCGSEKFLPSDYSLPPEPGKDPAEVVSQAPSGVSVENLYFETVPLGYFTGIVTESGVLRPEEAGGG